MLKFKLPTRTQTAVNDDVVTTLGSIDISIDTSIASEIRWETEFPSAAAKESLFAYIARCNKITDTSSALSAIKGLYCFIEFEKATSFLEFCKMFNFADMEFFNSFVDAIKNAFEMIYPEVKKKDL